MAKELRDGSQDSSRSKDGYSELLDRTYGICDNS